MALLRRSPRLPPDVADRLDLDEDVLATAQTAEGWVAATSRGIHMLTGDVVLHRTWVDVDGARAVTDPPGLHVTWVDGTRETELRLTDDRPRPLLRVVHERVQGSVVHVEKVDLGRRRSVRVVLRRDADGALLTQVIGPGDVDLADPATAEAVDAAERRVREAAGLR